jgi:hypothetical protein
VIALILYSWWFDYRINDLKGENRRLKEELALEKPENVRPLIGLTNNELKRKGTNAVQTIRLIISYHQDEEIRLKMQREKREITDIQFQELSQKENKRAEEEFDTNIRVDALMIYEELARRVPATAKMQFGLPRLNPADKRDESISLYRMPVGIMFAPILASDIEERVKALPD